MSAASDPILFEAVSTPPRSLSDRGMRWLVVLSCLGAAIPAVLFTLLGAWPVLPFLGIEVLLVLFLVTLHRRWTKAAREVVRLTEGRLLVSTADGRGGRRVTEFEPYWTRVALEEEVEGSPRLLLVQRGRRVELGGFLAPEEKRDLARALSAALSRYRNPVFDNPQLR
ncbi:DUF2244 domain-containing protein [Falsiroseomonas stagni]|uniref:Uncharacterized membrane protein n=1 Tax=Falsiroseomonas stagni DSM 19981 TaxID=1123062 RepID=A0A1I4A3I6_9PROT|nr:DUF2244 domain-containing protein [Falsiroseomonas stagni]SFK50319.1 Uncharacterized membrane protein [Falsiroseomonas stagni DSM 19981]